MLTSREKEIIRLVAKGNCNKEIADELFIKHREEASSEYL